MPLNVCLNARKIAHLRMPIKVNLQKRGFVLLYVSCPLCGDYDETEDHVFVHCPTSRRILQDVCRWWGVNCDFVSNVAHLLNWGYDLNFKGDLLKVFTGVIYSYCWLVWKLRNGKVFPRAVREKEPLVFSQIQAYAFFWLKNRSKRSNFANRWMDWLFNPASCC